MTTETPLQFNVDELSVFPRLESAEQVRRHPGSCFCEIMPGSDLTAAALFPGHVAVWTGEMGPPDWWSDQDSNIDPLYLFKVRDVFLFPAYGVVICPGGEVLRLPMQDAAYFSPDLSALPRVGSRAGQVVFEQPEAVEILDRSALVMALGAKVNYGHFMLDCLPAAASIRGTGQFDDFPFHVPPLQGWQRRHFQLLGIAAAELAGDIYRVGELVYTSGMHHFLHKPNFNYQEVRARQLQEARPAGRQHPKRIYLSRDNYANRTLLSDDALRRRLSRLGFVSIDPASLGVDEQIALFHGAEVIVGSAGAGFANVLYCEPGTLIVEIQPAGMQNHWVRNICLQNRCRFVAYFCKALEGDPEKPEISLRFDLDIDRFVETLANYSPLDAEKATSRGWLANLKELALFAKLSR